MLLPFQQWSNLLKELTCSTHLYRHWILLDTSKHVNSNLLQQSLPIWSISTTTKIIEDSEKSISKRNATMSKYISNGIKWYYQSWTLYQLSRMLINLLSPSRPVSIECRAFAKLRTITVLLKFNIQVVFITKLCYFQKHAECIPDKQT